MKKIILLVSGILLGSGMCFSQTLSPTVIASAGTVFTDGTTSLSWTLGEIAVSTITSGSNKLTQGFHQPEINIPIGIDNASGQNFISAFPNPVSDNLVLALSTVVTENISVEIMDMLGRVVKSETLYSGTAETKHTIQMSDFAPGAYLVKASGKNSKLLKTIKITKI